MGINRLLDRPPMSLYVHIPFCETKCPYCDFNTYSRIELLIPSYVKALRAEIELWGNVLDSPSLETVFFGGGTPSYIPVDDLSSIIQSVIRSFRLQDGAEITLECNPGDLDESTLRDYLVSGVNRISIGVQSFDDQMLSLLGRRHNSDQAMSAFDATVRAGFRNVSIDLMYGLPDQTLAMWSKTLKVAAQLNPRHISLYGLTLEEGTPLERWVSSGRVSDPDPDLAADMYLLAEDKMISAGYVHYEISNWSKPGFESRHNLTYWKNLPYLGVGPGAHSYVGTLRFHNLRSPREYISRLSDDQMLDVVRKVNTDPDDELVEGNADKIHGGDAQGSHIGFVPVVENMEAIDSNLEMSETMMMGLRLDAGIDRCDFMSRFGAPLNSIYGEIIAELESDGLLEDTESHIRLTARGRLLGNEVFSRFITPNRGNPL